MHGHPPQHQPDYGQQGGYGGPAPQTQPKKADATMAWLAMGLGLASWIMQAHALLSIPGFFIARSELKDMEAGLKATDHRSLTRAAYWINLINILLTLLGLVGFLLFFFFFGGLMLFGAAAGG